MQSDLINIIAESLMSGLDAVIEYLAQHVITCLVPAFLIAGAIGALIKKEAILRLFGATVPKYISYTVASVSGIALAVCSCTILPLFAGIYKKGAGLGPATTFLFAGPAINILAMAYTAQVLGLELGLARAFFAILLALMVGLVMAIIFREDLKEEDISENIATSEEAERPVWITLLFFILLFLMLIVAASPLSSAVKWPAIYVLTLSVALILIYHFSREEVTEWGFETWDLTKKIFPLLIAGTFILGVFAYFVPPESFRPYLGDSNLWSNLLASVMGAVLYMPTLLEVPVVGGTLGYSSGVMSGGPALALLLSGPTTSLPSLVVLYRVMGLKKTMVYWLLVVAASTTAGIIYGMLI